MGLNGSLDGLVEELERLLVQAEAEVYTRQSALDEAKKDAQRIRAMLKAAGALEEEPKAQPKPKREGRISDETRAKVLAAIAEWELNGGAAIPGVVGSFTATDIKGDFHESSGRNAIHVLREEGLLRAVGKKPVGKARAPVAYARVVFEEDEPRVG